MEECAAHQPSDRIHRGRVTRNAASFSHCFSLQVPSPSWARFRLRHGNMKKTEFVEYLATSGAQHLERP